MHYDGLQLVRLFPPNVSVKLQNHVKAKRTFEISESDDSKKFSHRTLETKQDPVEPTQIFF